MPIQKLKRGEKGNVVVARDPGDGFKRETNVPKYTDSNHAFEWGYCGGGPTEFALNILLHFTRCDEPFSRYCCREFRDEFVRKLPRPGGEIPKDKITAFIREKRRLFQSDEAFKEYRASFKMHMGHEAMERLNPPGLRIVPPT